MERRQEAADQNRNRVLEAATLLLATSDIGEFSLETVARKAGVTRQTVHNQFGSRTGLLKAVFNQLARHGGMMNMATVMQQSDPEQMLKAFVEVFVGFWSSDRITLRRIQAFATLDPEFSAAVEERNSWRRRAAMRVVERLSSRVSIDKHQAANTLHALTSFQFFDAFAGSRFPQEVSAEILHLARAAILS